MFFRKIHFFTELDSTNDYIKSNLSLLNSGDIVVASRQLKGRGRFSNVWLSEEGNLYFSFLIRKLIVREEIFLIIMRSAVAVLNVLNKYKINAKIKYPNDILVEQKKICGILLETIGYEKIQEVIVGIGINVNQQNFGELDDVATSIKLETKQSLDPESVLEDFIKAYGSLNNQTDIWESYRKELYFKKSTIEIEGITYVISHVEPNGKLVVVTQDGAKTIDYQDFSSAGIY